MEGDTSCKRAFQTLRVDRTQGTLTGSSCRDPLAADWQLLRMPVSGIAVERRKKSQVFVCLKTDPPLETCLENEKVGFSGAV